MGTCILALTLNQKNCSAICYHSNQVRSFLILLPIVVQLNTTHNYDVPVYEHSLEACIHVLTCT